MATTTTWSITYPTTANNITPLATHFANLANSTDTALTSLQGKMGSFRGLDAAKGAAGQEGRTYYATDTNRAWFDDGANWIGYDGGMYIVRPTSVVGGTIATDGIIVPTAGATTLSVNGVFTTRFRRYRIEYFYNTPADAGSRFRFRNAGVDEAGANYREQLIYGDTTAAPAGAQQNGTTQFTPTPFSGTAMSGNMEVTNPAISTNKSFRSDVIKFSGAAGLGLTAGIGIGPIPSSTYDGFSFSLSASSFAANGWFRVYGMA